MPSVRSSWALPALWLGLGAITSAAAGLPRVPEGFQVRLVASVPAVQYPSQVATAPDGSLFVGEDPMDQVGPADKPIDRILLFLDGKDPVVFAQALNAIFGMVWHDGALYVINMPNLTVLRDTDGDGVADERQELFTDLGVPAGSPNNFNDHIVSGLQIGIDNYLYVSVGDKGVPEATGPDGGMAQVVGGGTLRCRLDGAGLEVFSTGTRNHLEPNLDARDNLFTYDNTDDGQGWWTRVTHHVDGGHYGYPYDYHDRPDRMLPRMAEYGGGSPCGGIVYKEDVWPEPYRGRAIWAEWAKRQVRAFSFAPRGATFEVADVIEFVEPKGLGDFRPLDLALSYDGRTMYIADWGMGGWGSKTEKLGRVYAVTYTGAVATRPRGRDSDPIEAQIRQLDHPSFNERRRAQTALSKRGREALAAVSDALASSKTDPVAKRHLVWTLDAIAGGTPEASEPLIASLRSPWPDVRSQAARALGVRAVPIAEEPLKGLLDDPEHTVQLQAVIALGRIGASAAVEGLLPLLASSDTHLTFSTRQALRRIGDWKATAVGLDSHDPKVRVGTMLTLELIYKPEAAEALARYATDPTRPDSERARALTWLAEGHRKVPPWDGKWWGTQPTRRPPPARTIDWEGTPLVLETIRKSLVDPVVAVRAAAVRAATRSDDRPSLPTLRARLATEDDLAVRLAIVRAFGTMRDQEALPLLAATVRDANAAEPVRKAALMSIEGLGGDAAVPALIDLLGHADLGVELRVRTIAAVGKLEAKVAVAPLLTALKDPEPAVRAAAVEALSRAGRVDGVAEALRPSLNDPSIEVRNRGIAAMGRLKDREAILALLLAADADPTRFEAILALAAMPDPRAFQVYLRGLGGTSPKLREASATALTNLGEDAVPILEELARRHELSPSLLPELRRVFTSARPVADWHILGPFAIEAAAPVTPDVPIDVTARQAGEGDEPISWKPAEPVDAQGQVDLGAIFSKGDKIAVYGYAEFQSPAGRPAQFVVGSDDTLTVWLNGKEVYDFNDHRSFKHDQARIDVELASGTNRILVKCGNHGGDWQFAVAVTTAAEYAFLNGPATGGFNPEVFRAHASKGGGKPENGRALFADLKGLACIKCHAVGGQGGAVGPELSSVGAKYPRDELISAVLYPSAKISMGFEPIVVAASDGRILTGIVKSDTPEALEIEDAEARHIRIPAADIEERKRSEVSIMPSGLAEGLTQEGFADLIAYLETLKESNPQSAVRGGTGHNGEAKSPHPPAGR